MNARTMSVAVLAFVLSATAGAFPHAVLTDDWVSVAKGTVLTRDLKPAVLPKGDGTETRLTDGEAFADPHVANRGRVTKVPAMGSLVFDLGKPRPVSRALVNFSSALSPGQIIVSASNDGRRFLPIATASFDPDRRGKTDGHPWSPPIVGVPDTSLSYAPRPPRMLSAAIDVGRSARWFRLDIVQRCSLAEVALLEGKAGLPGLKGLEDRAARPNVTYMHTAWQDAAWGNTAGDRRNLLREPEISVCPEPAAQRLAALTDGQRHEGGVWQSRGAWRISRAGLRIDLGEPRPIQGVLVRGTMGGPWEYGATGWEVLLSEDGERYYLASELTCYPEDSVEPADMAWPSMGVPWYQQVIYLPVNRRARHLLVRTVRGMFIDEMAIVEGPGNAPAIDKRSELLCQDCGFTVTPIVPGDRITVASGLWMPFYMDLADHRRPEDREDIKNKTWFSVIDLPKHVEVQRMSRVGDVEREGKPYVRWRQSLNDTWVRSWYLMTRQPAGTREMAYVVIEQDKKTVAEVSLPLEVIDIPAVPRFERLHVSLAWMSEPIYAVNWPEGVETYARLGFNALPTMAHYWDYTDPEANPKYAAAIERGRKLGLKMVAVFSPGPPRVKQAPPTVAQAAGVEGEPVPRPPKGEDFRHIETYNGQRRLPDQPPDEFEALDEPEIEYRGGYCIGYEGPLLKEYAENLARRVLSTRPERAFFDIEQFKYWYEFPWCLRYQKLARDKGYASWNEYRRQRGVFICEQWRAALEARAKAAGASVPLIGHYRTEPRNEFNDGLFDWALLYPKHVQFAMPSVYSQGNVERTVAILKTMRRQIPSGEIIPWLTPATYGDFLARKVRDEALEAFVIGCKGVTYYRFAEFNAEKFARLGEAFRWIQPYEDVVADGKPLEGLRVVEGPDHAMVKGLSDGKRALILVSYYRQYLNSGPFTVEIELPSAVRGRVVEVDSGHPMRLAEDGRLAVALGDLRARLYAVALGP